MAEGPCIDFEWATLRTPPRCRRKLSCGAYVPDKCPLAEKPLPHPKENDRG